MANTPHSPAPAGEPASEFDPSGVKWRAGSQLTRRVTLTFDQGKELVDHMPVGTVNLPNGGRPKMGRFPLALRGDARFGDFAPDDHRLGTKRAIVR
jgi:hypothetical protein